MKRDLFVTMERDAEMDAPLRREINDTPLKGVRSNIVQSIRAFRVQDLQDAARSLGQHFLYANLANAQSKQDVLDLIAQQFMLPTHFDKTFDALYAHGEEDDEDLWAYPPAEPSGAAHISDSPVYLRGAMVLHKIRQTAGDDTFRDILRGWATAHRHGSADTGDFTRYVEKKAPEKDFGEIWDDWLYGDGKPDHP